GVARRRSELHRVPDDADRPTHGIADCLDDQGLAAFVGRAFRIVAQQRAELNYPHARAWDYIPERIIYRGWRVVYFRDSEADRGCVTLRIGCAIGCAVVSYRVLEAGWSIEVSCRREIDIGRVTADRAAHRIADTRQCQRLSTFISRSLRVIAKQ